MQTWNLVMGGRWTAVGSGQEKGRRPGSQSWKEAGQQLGWGRRRGADLEASLGRSRADVDGSQ